MKHRIWTVAAALASVAALYAVPSALAAYTTAKLEVRQTATGVNIKATGSPDDDPTASVRIFVPTGMQLTTNQAPGSVLGTGPVVAGFAVAALTMGWPIAAGYSGRLYMRIGFRDTGSRANGSGAGRPRIARTAAAMRAGST